ncbi:MAG: hypothetical protein ACRDZ3_14880 [Acidimicrobiia bacterium]
MGGQLTWRLVRQVFLLMAVAVVAALAVAPAVASTDASEAPASGGGGERRLTLVSADAAGTERSFTATLESSAGDGWQAVAGEEITFAYVTDGAGSVTAVNGGPVGSMRCESDSSGRCTITVRTDEPGAGVVMALSGSLSASAPTG